MKQISAFISGLFAILTAFSPTEAAPIITATKDDNLAAGLRKVPGNQITYTITISNTGDATATNVQFADPDPANTTFVSVNSTPIARNDAYSAIGNVQISIPSATGLLANDNDPDGVGPALTVTAVNTIGTQGNVTFNADGSFTFNPAAGFTGATTFGYTMSDGEGNTDTATVTITVTGTIWFINAAAGAGGDGRLTAPFNSVANYLGSAPTKDAGDNIFLFTGSYTGLTLGTNQRLIGQGANSTLAAITGLTPPTGSAALPTTGGTRPTIAVSAGTGIILNSGNTVAGLNVTNSNGSGITGSAVGTLTLADFGVTVTGGTALSLTTSGTVTATGVANTLSSTNNTVLNLASVTIGAGGMTLKSVSATSAANGISLVSLGGGSLTVTGDGTGRANGTGGTIANATTEAVHMLSNSGTFTFTSMSFAMNTSAIDGILVDNNAGGTIAVNFTGCTFTGVTASASQNKSLLQYEAGGAANVTANVQNTFFNSSRTYGLFTTGAGTSVMNVTVNQCGFGTEVNTGAAVNQPGTAITNPPAFGLGITNGSSAQVTYNVTNNTFWGADGLLGAIYAVTISGASTTASATLNGAFNGNKIGKTGVTGSGASNGAAGLGLLPGTLGQFHATVIGNDIRQVNTLGVNFFNSVTAGNTDATLKIKGNTFAEPDTTGAPVFLRAIVVSPGNSGGANNPWKAEIGDTTGTVPANKNNISGSWQAGFFIRVTNNNNTAALTLPGLTPTSGATAAQVNTFVQNANTLPASSVGSALGTAGIIGGAALPLLYAPAEVASFGLRTPDSMSSAVAWSENVNALSAGAPRLLKAPALTQSELDTLVAAALARWAATGLSDAQLATLRSVKFTVADLPGWYLGEADGDRIRVDSDAGGNGWFIGAAAEDDAQFAQEKSATRRYTVPTGAPAGRIDLLTAILHEMGHALGLDDTYAEPDRDSLMYGFLTKGERRLPAKNQAADATPHAETHPHFLGTPLTIGDLPVGKTVTITYVVTINATSATAISNQGTVSGGNIASKVTNDPQTGAADDATITPLNQPPVVSSVGPLSVNEDAVLAFAGANFSGGYSDPNGDAIASVIITSLPVNGVLKNGATTLTTTPVVIAIANISSLTYTPGANYNGADSFTWNASDGTLVANSVATVNLTVNAVNDKPTFTAANPPAVSEDAGAQTVTGWAAFNAGAANESGQAVLAYAVSSISNGALFSAPPSVAANGTLTYTPATNANGTSTFQVRLQDNGGTAFGGVDLSDAQTFTITVNAVNDAPVITGQFAIATTENIARTILPGDLLVTDTDNTYPTGFTLSVQNGASYTRVGNTITPALGFVGTLSVPVQVNDGAANSNVFNLVVTVNPTDAHAAVSTTIVPEPGGGFRITSLGGPGVTYVIQFTNSLTPTPTAWRDLGTRTADATGRYSIVDIPPANTPVRFYRSVLPYRNNFNAGLGTATLIGNATWTNQAVQLTDALGGQTGSVVLTGIAPGPAFSGFTAKFNVIMGPTNTAPTPADGISFTVGDLGAIAFGENGPATAHILTVALDTYENGAGIPEALGIRVISNGTVLAYNATNPYTNALPVPVEVSFDIYTGVTVKFNGATIFTNVAVPGFTFQNGDRFGFGGRTGGADERNVIDDVEITPR